MDKRLIAIAVAGAFAPGIVSAQVTVSGKFGIQLSNVKIDKPTAARAGLNTSSWIVNDNTSIIRIAAREDLGSGLEAFGQYEIRPLMDSPGGAPAGTLGVGSPTGVSYVGLRSNTWGSLRAGTDVTWGERGVGLSTSGSTQYSAAGLLNFVQLGATTLNFSTGRQQNLVIYDTPDMSGLKVTAIYSTSPLNPDNDMSFPGRKGNGWYLVPEYATSNWKAGFAYADIKQDLSAAAIATNPLNLKASKLYGEFNVSGVEFGLTWAKITAVTGVTAGATAAGTKQVDVTKWLLPVRYRVGNNTFGFMYGKSGDDKVQAGSQKSSVAGLSYVYSFSRRTNAGISWAKAKNDAGASYDLTSTINNGYFVDNGSANLGEDQSIIALSLNHNF